MSQDQADQKEPLTYDEFLDGIQSMLADFNDPNSVVSTLLDELKLGRDEVRIHDPEFAARMHDVELTLLALKIHGETTYGDELTKRDVANSMSDQ